jgi:hypothetical protein
MESRSVKFCQFITFLGAFCVVMTLPGVSDAARIKCWKNKEGIRECGNTVPPEYAQQGHKEVSKSGLTVKTQKAARSKEAREAEQRAQQKAAVRQRKEQKRRRKQVALDRVLLDTFVTERGLTLAHERKIRAIKSQISHRKKHIAKLEAKLALHQKAAGNQERSGQEVSAATLEKIGVVQRQIDDNEKFTRAQYGEMDKLEAVYKADLGRYRFLKTGGEIGAPPQA